MGSGEADTRSKSGDGKKIIAAHWFRQDLRLHDNPALLKAIDGCDEFYPLFIFDGKVASKCSVLLTIWGSPKVSSVGRCWQSAPPPTPS